MPRVSCSPFRRIHTEQFFLLPGFAITGGTPNSKRVEILPGFGSAADGVKNGAPTRRTEKLAGFGSNESASGSSGSGSGGGAGRGGHDNSNRDSHLSVLSGFGGIHNANKPVSVMLRKGAKGFGVNINGAKTAEEAKERGHGIIVTKITPGSPAAKNKNVRVGWQVTAPSTTFPIVMRWFLIQIA